MSYINGLLRGRMAKLKRGKKLFLPLSMLTLFCFVVYVVTVRYSIDPYRRIMNETHANLMDDILQAFVTVCESHNLTYQMYWGTLLGSYRHHGMIPWDDDVDMLLSYADKDALGAGFKQLGKPYVYFKGHEANASWKLFRSEPIYFPLPKRQFEWPFVDIFFYDENSTHIWDVTWWYAGEYVYRKKDMFPLQKRPFRKFRLPSPCNPVKVLQDAKVLLDKCSAGYSDHTERFYHSVFRRRTQPCSTLHNAHSFVFREKSTSGWTEQLRFKGKVQQTITLPDYCSS